jgi:DNA replication protein DnaC
MQASKKTSSPENSNKPPIDLMKVDLRIAGQKLTGDETHAQIVELHNQMRVDRERRADEVMKLRFENQRRENLQRGRDWLKARGIGAATWGEAEVRAKIDEIESEDRRQNEIRRAEWQEQQDRQRMESLFRASNSPRRHAQNLDLIDAAKFPKWYGARRKLEMGINKGGLFALLGNRGTGKTQMSVSLILGATRRLKTARYTTASDLFRELRASFGQSGDGESEQAIMRRLISYDILVIDELHQRSGTAFEENAIVSLIDARYRECRFTLLIANQTREEFSAGVGDSVVSRIHECGECIVCDWPTFRIPGQWKSDAEATR